MPPFTYIWCIYKYISVYSVSIKNIYGICFVTFCFFWGEDVIKLIYRKLNYMLYKKSNMKQIRLSYVLFIILILACLPKLSVCAQQVFQCEEVKVDTFFIHKSEAEKKLGEQNIADTVLQGNKQEVLTKNLIAEPFSKRKSFNDNFTYRGLGLIAAGFYVKVRKKEFREMRNFFHPTYKSAWDNVSQYSPLLATWVFNLCGVEGHSTLPRLSVSSALSVAFMAAMVNMVKYSTKELRPDGSSRNSFPSGHTATAFMAATILHKEYGLTRSAWYSVAGYSVAGATAIGRILNNRHWASDVLVGAGVGMIATDIGYFVTDLLFKNKGIKRRYNVGEVPDILDKPTFFGLNIETGFMVNHLKCPSIYDNYDANMQPYPVGDKRGESRPLGLKLVFGASTSVGAEGAYFINRYVGFGGMVHTSVVPVKGTITLLPGFRYNMNVAGCLPIDDRYIRLIGIESNHIGLFDFCGGVYLSYPFSKRFRVGTKLLVGSQFTTDYRVSAVVDVDTQGLRQYLSDIAANDKRYFEKPEDKRVLMEKIDKMGDGRAIRDGEFLRIKSAHAPIVSTDLSVTWAYRHGMSFRAFVGYDYSRPVYTYLLTNRCQQVSNLAGRYVTNTFDKHVNMSKVSIGLGMAIQL